MGRIEGGRISARQLMAVLILNRIVPVTITYPLIVGLEHPRDAWIGALLGTLVSVPFVLLVTHLGLKFPDSTIIEYGEKLLNRFLGKFIGLVLVCYWVHISANVARAVGEAYTIAVMPKTPILVFMVVMVFLGANAARQGLELVGRISEGLLWVVLLFLVLMFLLPYDSMHFANLTPVLAKGLQPILEPTGTAFSFFTEFIVIGMVIPYLNKPREAKRFTVYAVLTSGLLMTVFTVVLIAVFGSTASSLSLPAFSLARRARVAQFYERVEVISLMAWTMSAGTKLALYLWASCIGLAQVFGIERFRSFAYPLGAIAVALGVLLYESYVDLSLFLSFKHWGVYSSILTLSVMAVLYVAALLRGKLTPLRRR